MKVMVKRLQVEVSDSEEMTRNTSSQVPMFSRFWRFFLGFSRLGNLGNVQLLEVPEQAQALGPAPELPKDNLNMASIV